MLTHPDFGQLYGSQVCEVLPSPPHCLSGGRPITLHGPCNALVFLKNNWHVE